ncbi:MAG: winged helix-turn-helix domain-containing protein, partial [Flexilinea sp.]|nr:winged helix-turn-helix domain-containing protein [Flexilinea sp.]
ILFLYIGYLFEGSRSVLCKEKILRNLLLISSHKNLVLSGRSFHTSPKGCRSKLLAYLNSVSQQRHSLEFDIPFDRQQLADYLNLERTNMSKELGRMRDEGIIVFRKNHFKLLRKE